MHGDIGVKREIGCKLCNYALHGNGSLYAEKILWLQNRSERV